MLPLTPYIKVTRAEEQKCNRLSSGPQSGLRGVEDDIRVVSFLSILPAAKTPIKAFHNSMGEKGETRERHSLILSLLSSPYNTLGL